VCPISIAKHTSKQFLEQKNPTRHKLITVCNGQTFASILTTWCMPVCSVLTAIRIIKYRRDIKKSQYRPVTLYTVIHNYGNPWFLLYSFLINRHKVITFSTLCLLVNAVTFAKTLLTRCVFIVSAFGFNACTSDKDVCATVWLLHQ